MDFGNAALLASTVFVVLELAKLLAPAIKTNTQALAAVIIVTCQAVPFLVAHSDWGAKQVVDGIALSNMNQGSLTIVGLALAGLAGVAYKLLAAIPSIGENQPKG